MDSNEANQSVDYLTCKIEQKECMKVIKKQTKKLQSNEKKLKFFNELPTLNKKNRLLYTVRNKKYVLILIVFLPVIMYLGLTVFYLGFIDDLLINVIGKAVNNVFLTLIILIVLFGGSIILLGTALMSIILLYENGRSIFLDEDLKDTLNSLQDEIRIGKKTIVHTTQELEKTNQKLLTMNQK